jgi:outer membrane protein TolC
MKRFIILLLCICGISAAYAQKSSLDQFVNRAIAGSPLLREYNAEVTTLSLDSQLILAGLRPQVNGNSNNFYAPVIGGWGYDNAITNGAQLSALVSVSKSLVNKKSTATRFENIRLQQRSALNNGQISEKEIRRTITDQYITAYGEQMQLEFYRHLNDMLRQEDSLLLKLTRDNVYRQSDYLSFRVTVQQQELITTQLENQFRYDCATLHYLSGDIDTSAITLEDPGLNDQVLHDLEGSVFYKQFELDSLKLANDKDMIGLDYRPKINLFGDAGYYSSLALKPYKNFGTSAGISIIVPIYDGKQRKVRYSQIGVQELNRQYRKDYFSRQQQQQIAQGLQQLHATDDLSNQLNKQVSYTETLITVNEKLLATGDIRLTDFILSINNYYTALNLVTQQYINRLRILNQLHYWSR